MKPIARHAVLLTASLLLQSCFPMALWGLDTDDDDDDSYYAQRNGCHRERKREPLTWETFGCRLLLTPITLGLDLLTSPIQACLDDDDDESCERRRRRSGN